VNWLTVTAHAVSPAEGDVVIRGSRCRTRAGLFDEWARALRFPAHFGRNWDAFYDALADRARERPTPLSVLVTDADELLIDEPPEQLTLLLDAARDAATGRLLGEPPGEPRLLLTLADAGTLAGRIGAAG
jgi:RNAse (barnase) inhibitor barstar